MFGIEDPLIWLPYLLMVACVIFSAWYGLKNWHVDDKADKAESEARHSAEAGSNTLSPQGSGDAARKEEKS
jgi:hypothetical protein